MMFFAMLLSITHVYLLVVITRYVPAAAQIETEIQYGIQESTPQPTVKSSSGLSEAAKLGLEIGIPVVVAVIALIGLIIAYKRCRIEIEARNRERRREDREIRMAQGGNASGSGYTGTNTVLREADTDRRRRAGEPEDSPDGNLAGHEDAANEPLLDKQLSDIDILDVVTIFALAKLSALYRRLHLTAKDFSDILQQDNIFQQQTTKILTLWCDRNGEDATREAMIKAMEECPDLTDPLGKLKTRWVDRGRQVDQVDILDIVELFQLPDLEDNLYEHLKKLENKDIENIKAETERPLSKKQAKKLLHLWRSRNGEAASRKKIIEAIKLCPDLKGKLGELKKKWKERDHNAQ